MESVGMKKKNFTYEDCFFKCASSFPSDVCCEHQTDSFVY